MEVADGDPPPRRAAARRAVAAPYPRTSGADLRRGRRRGSDGGNPWRTVAGGVALNTSHRPQWFWWQVYLHCLLAAAMDQPVHFASRIDGALLPDIPWWY